MANSKNLSHTHTHIKCINYIIMKNMKKKKIDKYDSPSLNSCLLPPPHTRHKMKIKNIKHTFTLTFIHVFVCVWQIQLYKSIYIYPITYYIYLLCIAYYACGIYEKPHKIYPQLYIYILCITCKTLMNLMVGLNITKKSFQSFFYFIFLNFFTFLQSTKLYIVGMRGTYVVNKNS